MNIQQNTPDFPSKDCLPHIVPQPINMTFGEAYVNLNEFKLEAKETSQEINKLFTNEFPLNEAGSKTLKLIVDNNVESEAYTLLINVNSISVNASDDRGFFYAFQTMKQLTHAGHAVSAQIEDKPKLGMRGFHFNLGSVRSLKFHDVIRIVKMLGKFKMNTLLLEYSERFPFEKHSTISCAEAFTKEQTQEIEQIAKENYVDIIPLVQSLGHVRHILRHSEYQHLLEIEDGAKGQEQLCPLNPDSIELFKETALEIMKAHPDSKYLHIGADETRQLGACPKCSDFVNRYGKSKLYTDYMNQVCRWVKEQGRTPILWDDMLSRNLDAVDMLDKDAVIMYWDYWTTSQKSPMMVARGAGYGVVYDKRWDTEWAQELEEPERSVVNDFSRGIDLKNDFDDRYMEAMGPYLGDDFPKFINAFPNIGFFQDKGFKVIGAPTTLGNRMDDTFGLPNYNRFLGNIREFSSSCINHQSVGLVTTAWYDFPPEILDLGIMSTANSTWNGSNPSAPCSDK